MAGDVTITVKFDKLPAVNPKLRSGAARALNTAIMATIGYADPLTPVDKNLLRSNKTIGIASPGSLNASVTWNQFYGIYQHEGTSRGVTAKKFASQGAERATPNLIAGMKAVGAQLV